MGAIYINPILNYPDTPPMNIIRPYIKSAALNQGLVLHYKFAGNTVDEVSGNNGILGSGVSYVTNHLGVAGSALSFDNTANATLITTNNVDLSVTDKVTMCAWVNLQSRPTTSFYLQHGYEVQTPNNGLAWGAFNLYREQLMDGKNPNRNWFQASSSISYQTPANTWVHMSWTSDRSLLAANQMSQYYNGIVTDPAAGNAIYLSDINGNYGNFKMSMGAHPYFGNCAAAFSDLRIYNRILSAAEILTIYQTT